MTGPICNFVSDYIGEGWSRLHMPGHKGWGPLGFEARDITEFLGADDLSCPTGIILESENRCSALFGTRHSFYCTGGSSQALKAMVYLSKLGRPGRTILAGRNAHKSFLHACGLLDLEPLFMNPAGANLCSCPITPDFLERELSRLPEKPLAVFVTSPDYLGRLLDIASLAKVCHNHELPLLVDNAHGAYLHFLDEPRHPMDLGADLCCDSAHKTLPVLTGGAYLHVGRGAMGAYEENAREALSLFGSSSPSYLILQSLDSCNGLLAGDFPRELNRSAARVELLRQFLPMPSISMEPLKLTLNAAAIGGWGQELARALRENRVEPEYVDEDFVVLMFSPGNREEDFLRVSRALAAYPVRRPRPMVSAPPAGERALSLHRALLAPRERVPIAEAAGRICAEIAVSCPPAIPLAILGEKISPEAARYMKELGMESIAVVQI